MPPKLTTHTVDEYGVVNYNPTYLALITLTVLYSIIAIFAYLLLHFEQQAANANILTYKDAFWTLQMSASTIGFGDHYPITTNGRVIVALMFYIGVGMVGFIGAQFVNRFVGFSDTNVKNRELRKQNDELLAQNKQLEQKLDNILNHLIFADKKKSE
jgi:voltage-gated potassium channel